MHPCTHTMLVILNRLSSIPGPWMCTIRVKCLAEGHSHTTILGKGLKFAMSLYNGLIYLGSEWSQSCQMYPIWFQYMFLDACLHALNSSVLRMVSWPHPGYLSKFKLKSTFEYYCIILYCVKSGILHECENLKKCTNLWCVILKKCQFYSQL